MRHTLPASYMVLLEQAQRPPSRARLRSATASMMLQQQWPVDSLRPIYEFAQPPWGSSGKQACVVVVVAVVFVFFCPQGFTSFLSNTFSRGQCWIYDQSAAHSVRQPSKAPTPSY